MSATSHQQIQILHVDDEPDFADLTRTFLEREDDRFTVETATSADDGLEILEDRPPDCVISDYNMPGTDGLEFLQAVRQEYPDLPFILFTGKGSEAVASDALRAGATDYIQKQSGAEQYELLANRIENTVTQYRSEERLRETRKEYTAVFENAQNALILVRVEDDGFRYQQCNPQTVELIGRDKTDIVGNTPHEALGPENGTKVAGAYRTCIERREPVAYAVTLDLPMGEVIRECEVAPVSSDGEIKQLVVEFRDVTEQRQRQQELEEYGTIIEALTDAVYVLDEEGQFTYVNDEFVELVGYDRETILGNRPSLIKDEPAVEQAEQQLGRLLSDDGPDTVTFEVTVHPRDGDPTVCEDHMGVLPYEGDQFNGSVGTLRDITDRKERERELEETTRRLDFALEATDTGVWQWDMETDEVVWSETLERLLGIETGSFDGSFDAHEGYLHPDAHSKVDQAVAEAREGGGTFNAEFRMVREDGEEIWVEGHGERIADDEDQRMIGTTRDITERKEHERGLEISSRQYETLVENFPDGAVYLIDANYECIRADGEELHNVGLSPTDVEGKTPHDLFPADIAEELCHYYEDTLAGNSHTFEQEYEGERYRIRTAPVRTGDGTIEQLIAVSQNITEHAEDKQNLERQNERLAEFASIISHDLRSPLTVAEGHLELAQDTCESDHLARATNALDRSQALIDDLLTVAQEGQEVAEVEPVALAEAAENSWQTVNTGAATLESDTPQVIRSDRSRLRQPFENLHRNAVEHGGAEVTVHVGPMDDGFYVADTGPGIPESDREEVFEAGYSTAEDGTGFGLRIVKQVAIAHGWEIAVTESEQGGARFEVTGVEFADR